MQFQKPYIIKTPQKGPGEFFFVRESVAQLAEELEGKLQQRTEDSRRWPVGKHIDLLREEAYGTIIAAGSEPPNVIRQEAISLIAQLHDLIESVELAEKERARYGNIGTASE